jgi:ecotropic viral integration site 5 protein
LTAGSSGASGGSQERGAGTGGAADDSEEDQWTLWGRLVADWDNHFKKKSIYVKELVRKGIPHHFRGVVWPLLW